MSKELQNDIQKLNKQVEEFQDFFWDQFEVVTIINRRINDELSKILIEMELERFEKEFELCFCDETSISLDELSNEDFEAIIKLTNFRVHSSEQKTICKLRINDKGELLKGEDGFILFDNVEIPEIFKKSLKYKIKCKARFYIKNDKDSNDDYDNYKLFVEYRVRKVYKYIDFDGINEVITPAYYGIENWKCDFMKLPLICRMNLVDILPELLESFSKFLSEIRSPYKKILK